MKSRRRVLLAACVGLGTAGATVALIGDRPAESSLLFGVLLGLLAAVCFRWWAAPVHAGLYNYFSPLALFGSLAFCYYGPGNLPGFISHDMMYLGNPGADEYYCLVMAACVGGMLALDTAYRIANRMCQPPAGDGPGATIHRFAVSPASPAAASVLFALSLSALIYLSSKYVIYSNAQIITSSELDNILAISAKSILILATGAWAFVFFRSGWIARAVLILGPIPLLPFLLAFFSRITAAVAVVACAIAYLQAKPGRRLTKRFLVSSAAVLVLLLLAITGVKAVANYDTTAAPIINSDRNLVTRSVATIRSDVLFDLEATMQFLAIDVSYRLGGLDFPAAIAQALRANSASPMDGRHFVNAASMLVPRALWPSKDVTDPELAIKQHYGLLQFDQLASPLASAFADHGVIGVIVEFAFLGLALCWIQRWIWTLPLAPLVYLAGLAHLCYFENYLAAYALTWLRSSLLLGCVCGLVMLLVCRVNGRGETAMSREPGPRRPLPSAV